MNDSKITKRGGNIDPTETKQGRVNSKYYLYKGGLDVVNDYHYYCVRCQLMYYTDALRCARCEGSLITKEQRIKNINEQEKEFQKEKEKRNKRRQKWKEMKTEEHNSKNSQNMVSTSARTAFPNYDKWDYFEPDSDSDPEINEDNEMESFSDVKEDVNNKSIPNNINSMSYSECFNISEDAKKKMDAFKKKTVVEDLTRKKENRDAAMRQKLKGNEFTQQKQYLQAIECYEDGLKLDNSCVELYTNLALCLNKTFQFKKAIQTCDKLLHYVKAFPGLHSVSGATMFKLYSRRGLAEFHLLRHEEALFCFNQASNYDTKDEVVRRYIYICNSYIENKRSIQYFVHRQKRERIKQKYSCPTVYPSLRLYRRNCCKSIIEYSKMTEEQVWALKIEDFVAIEGIVTICDNTEVLLNVDLNIRKDRTSEITNNSTQKCSPFFYTLINMLCTYMNEIIQLVHGDILKNQNVDIANLHIKCADIKVKAEHIIETLGSLAQKNPLYMDKFIKCVRPVLTFFALRLVSCHIAMFFLGTVVRNIKISLEVRRLIKHCSKFWDFFFKTFDRVCADFTTCKIPQKHIFDVPVMLEFSREADIKRKYCDYFSFLANMCLESEVNFFLMQTYADNIRNICRYINNQLLKNDVYLFYYMDLLKNIYIGGGYMKEDIFKICWNGIMHVLKTEKDKIRILMVIKCLDVLTFSWNYRLLGDKTKYGFLRKIEAETVENIINVWKKNGEESSTDLILMLTSFIKYNCHLEKEDIWKEMQNTVNVISASKKETRHSLLGNVVDTSVNITTGPSISNVSNNSSTSSTSTTSPKSATNAKEYINAYKTTGVPSSENATGTTIINANNSTIVRTSEPIATVDAPMNNICGNGSSILSKGADDNIFNVENNTLLETNNNLCTIIDNKMINVMIPIIYEGLSSNNTFHMNKECILITTLLVEHVVFFEYLNERNDITITNFIERVADFFFRYEKMCKEMDDHSIIGNTISIFNNVLKNMEILKYEKQETIDAMRPVLSIFIDKFKDEEYQPFTEKLLILLSIVFISEVCNVEVSNDNIRQLIMTAKEGGENVIHNDM